MGFSLFEYASAESFEGLKSCHLLDPANIRYGMHGKSHPCFFTSCQHHIHLPHRLVISLFDNDNQPLEE